MRDLQKIFEECLDNVRTLNIPVGEIESIQWAWHDKYLYNQNCSKM